MAKTFPFPEWSPDVAQLGTGVSGTMSGVVPRADGYGPFKSLEEFTQALPAGCRGYFFARRSDGSIAIFAGTSTRLYLLDNSTFAWTDVSKGGAAYSTLVTNSNWQFRQFNDLVIAVQVNTVPQKFTLSSSSAFADLGGSPPQAAFIAIVNRFVVLTGLLSATRRIQWSDLDAPETWTAGTGLADYQDLPDGGTVKAVAGGDMYGAVFQDESIRTITYSPGSATTFQITRLSTQDTLYAQYSPVEINGRIYFISAQGFKVIEPGGVPKPIGKERVDRTFFADVDTANLQLIVGCADPQSTRLYWSYKSGQGQAGLFDKVMCFDPAIGQNGRWTLLPIVGEYLASLARPGLTLEQLDAIAPTPLNVTGTGAGTAGRVRLTLNALSNADFNIVGQNFIRVYDVGGTVEANGTWAFNVIDATHIDLIGTTFANAWTSGGHIGGSLDALPFSLDSISTASIAALSAFNSDHKAGFFTGANIEAIMETSEQDLEGDMVFISSIQPITDAVDMLCSVGGRITIKQAVSYTAETAMDDADGSCGVLIETRYARVRARVPAASEWTYARAVQPEAVLAGDH
jgi:hypothetical protein